MVYITGAEGARSTRLKSRKPARSSTGKGKTKGPIRGSYGKGLESHLFYHRGCHLGFLVFKKFLFCFPIFIFVSGLLCFLRPLSHCLSSIPFPPWICINIYLFKHGVSMSSLEIRVSLGE